MQRLQSFAEAIGAGMDPPDMLDVMARARELDAFASQHDAQLAVHLHARGAAWSVGYIQQHARRHGFVPGATGLIFSPVAETSHTGPIFSVTSIRPSGRKAIRHGNPNVLVVVMVKGRLASAFCSPTLICAIAVADAKLNSTATFAKRIVASPCLAYGPAGTSIFYCQGDALRTIVHP